MTEERENRPNVNVVQLLAGTLAALSAAGVASILGVEGTIVGAGLGSVVATAGGAWYTWSLEQTHERLRTSAQTILTSARSGTKGRGSVAQEVAAAGAGPPESAAAGAGPPESAAAGGPTGDETQPAPGYGEVAATPASWRPPWRRLAILAAGTFLIAMAAITVFELATGQPLSATVRGEQGSGTTWRSDPKPAPAPSSTPTNSSTPSPGATQTGTPTPTAEPTATQTSQPTPSPNVPSSPAQSTPTVQAPSPGAGLG